MDRHTLNTVLEIVKEASRFQGSIDAKIAYNDVMIMVTQLILKTYDK
jgi:hypothetical protein